MNNNSDVVILSDINNILSQNPDANQRELAQSTNMSLGAMNAVIKRCIERGWIAVKNLNMKRMCYYLTSTGLEEVAIRSKRYINNTLELMNTYAVKIDNTLQNLKDNGIQKIVLVGESNISFLIEYECQKTNLFYENISKEEFKCDIIENTYVLLSENLSYTDDFKEQNVVSLMEIIG